MAQDNRPLRAFFAPVRSLFVGDASAGILLIVVAAMAMVAANSPLAGDYHDLFNAKLAWTPIPKLDTLHLWINDGLMAVFFFLIVMELKREMREGRLKNPADVVLPGVAALGGMIAPMAVFLLVTRAHPELQAGWAIPAATDIAFAVGVLALLGRSLPPSLRVFLLALAIIDDLTSLVNRRGFETMARLLLNSSERQGLPAVLLYFDLDEFKSINDNLCHDACDELLKEVAKRLTSRLREEDTIARLGGDEFAVILSGIKDRGQASVIAANLQQAFSAPVKLGNHEVSISASIGITVAPEDASEEELLLKHADLAMYEAKARGKNTFHFFSHDLNEAANERLLIENQLREAIREHQFMLYYQPKIDIRNNTIIGYETLLRWLRPDNTLVPPLRFISVAESTGLIVQIGEWIIWEACRFLTRQHSRGHDVTLSINLSVRQFNDHDLPEIVERILKRTGADPASLIFEITESMLMGDIDAAIVQLNELKRLGLALSIDDFGTGYSSLSYLKRFPVDELKIDRSFVKDIPDDTNDMDIVAAIIAMAQKMNLRVVAEGVETIEQVEFLKNNACYLVQGYYFSMPRAEQDLYNLSYQPLLIGAASL